MSDIDFLREMKTHLTAGRSGDPTEFEMLEKMIEDWIDELGNLPKFSVQELRPEVLAFALLMEARLREKDADKGQSWKDKSPFGLSTAALAKASFVQTCIAKPGLKSTSFAGDLPVAKLALEDSKHVVDVANFCMMLADVSGALDIEIEALAAEQGFGLVNTEALDIPAFLRKHKD